MRIICLSLCLFSIGTFGFSQDTPQFYRTDRLNYQVFGFSCREALRQALHDVNGGNFRFLSHHAYVPQTSFMGLHGESDVEEVRELRTNLRIPFLYGYDKTTESLEEEIAAGRQITPTEPEMEYMVNIMSAEYIMWYNTVVLNCLYIDDSLLEKHTDSLTALSAVKKYLQDNLFLIPGFSFVDGIATIDTDFLKNCNHTGCGTKL